MTPVLEIAGIDRVAIGEQHGEARLVAGHPHDVFREHVGTVGEKGDAAEALGLALGAEHAARGVEPLKLGIALGGDRHFGLDAVRVASERDHQRRSVHLPWRIGAVDLDRKRREPVTVEPQRPVVAAAPLHLQGRTHPCLGGVELEIERDLRNLPVGFAIIFAAGDPGSLGRGLNVGHLPRYRKKRRACHRQPCVFGHAWYM